VPTVSLPPDVVRLSAREPSDKPILGTAQRNANLYGELYVAATSSDTIVGFYQTHGARCYQTANESATYWRCDLAALPYGSAFVDILSQEAYRLKPDVRDVGIESYHLERPIPNGGTILRTFVVWCIDH